MAADSATLEEAREPVPINTIIFDWDGTLAQTLDLWLGGYDAALKRRGLHFQPDTIVKEFLTNHDTITQRHPDLDFSNVFQETFSDVRKGLDAVRLYQNARELIQSLHAQNISIGLVTSSPREMLQIGLNANSLSNAFQSIITGDDGFGHKPEPGPFLETLSRMGARSDETMILGDSAVDIEAGRAAGCQTCFFAPAHNQAFHDFQQIRKAVPDYEIASLMELNEVVKR